LICDSVSAFASGKMDDLQLYLWGEHGVGKSHLLSAACQSASANGYQVAYLPGELLNHDAVFDGLETCDLICIDDVQELHASGEEALFYCINRCRQAAAKMLFAASGQSDRLGFALADLCTRLSWGAVYHVQPLSESELQSALTHLFETRDMLVGDEVVQYMLRHFPRDFAVLKKLVSVLDEASLQSQRKVTVPLVSSVLVPSDYAVVPAVDESAR